jgi:hypothetical protein
MYNPRRFFSGFSVVVFLPASSRQLRLFPAIVSRERRLPHRGVRPAGERGE